MRRTLKLIALLGCFGAIVSSCSHRVEEVVPDKQSVFPLADFTVTPDPLDGFTFKFANASSKFTKLEMRFGDDSLSTSADVTHTYVNTGDPAKQFKYTIDLKAFSSTGDISHKYVDIPIYPDSIIKLNAVRIATNSPNATVKFTATVKANVKSYLWTFTDNRTATPVVFTRTEVSPEIPLFIGSMNSVSLKIVTDKGSTASVSRNVTVDGIATDITASYINKDPAYPSPITNNENTVQGVNEGAAKIVDGNPLTKYGFYQAFPNKPLIISLQFPAPVVVKSYGIMNGNDSTNERDPMEWYIEGSNDKAGPWTQLAYVKQAKGFYDQGTDLGLSGTNPATGKDIRYIKWWYFPLTTTGAYTWYRWRIVDVYYSNYPGNPRGVPAGKTEAFQMSEFALFK
ncbi:MAG: hypothetical protein V4553_04905 [Bacteroidota bacterium]